MQPTAKSLMLDLLSTVPRSSVPVRFLVEAAGLFDIDGNAVRVTLTRLAAKGLVASDGRGHYRLGPAAASVRGVVSSWRRGERRRRRWDGAWIAVGTGTLERSDRRALHDTRRALSLLGFAQLDRLLSVRADNLIGGIDAARQRLAELGLPAGLPSFTIRDLDPRSDTRARSLWDTDTLAHEHRAVLAGMARSRRRLERLIGSGGGESAAAMAESFLVGGEAIRLLARDPLLPDEIFPADDRRAVVAALRGYDELGRACWAPFMKRYGLTHGRVPRNLTTIDTSPAQPGVAAAATGANP